MVQIKEHKELTQDKAIQAARLPSEVAIPLLQHLGKPLDLLKVKAGDSVKRGQLLATSDGGIFAPVHASISGTVKAISAQPHPVVGFSRAVVIEGDGRDEPVPEMVARPEEDVDALGADELRRIIFEAGVVGLGGATFPAYFKLSPPKPITHFILNGAECEPYLTCDYRLMVEKTDELIKGVKLIARILAFQHCYIAIEDNKPLAIAAMSERARMFDWQVVVLKTAYPQGGEKQVIQSCLKRQLPSGNLPFDIGVVVHNVGTVYAIYEAVYLRKPLYERVVTVSGPCLSEPKNLLTRIGTRVKELPQECGGLVFEPKKIVMGGPMTGIAQYTMDGPVIKGSGGVLFFDQAAKRQEEESFCIRCAECVENCPIGLNPGLIAAAIAKDKLDLAQVYGVMDCIECGLCAYVCPSRRPIVQAVKAAKARLKNAKK